VAGAYRATPIRELEKEVLVPPIDIYCSELRARHIQRTYASPAGVFIQEQCSTIRGRLRRKRKKRAQAGRRQPAQKSVTQERIEWARQREQEYGCQSKKALLAEWRERWHEERGRKVSWPESIAALDQPSQSPLKLYSQLKKAESLAIFQARTGRIGLRRFLASARVPGLALTSAYVGKARRRLSMCFYTATTHLCKHGAEERSLGSLYLSQPLQAR
jgi:hypothetical protein